MTSIMETHLDWVQKLKDRGEEVLQPKVGEPMNSIDGYIKTQIPPKDAGSIFQDKDGKFGLFGDMGALHITGIEWCDLGLCDARCWYEWMSPETYKPKVPKRRPIGTQYRKTGIVWEVIGYEKSMIGDGLFERVQAVDTYDTNHECHTAYQHHECDPLIDIPVVAQRCNTCGRLHVYEVIATVGAPYKLRKIGTMLVLE